MPNIRLDLGSPVYDGQTLTFKSPADCSQVTGLKVYYPENNSTVSKTFQFADAHGNNVGSVSLFTENVLVKVILDTELNRAYVQNADTNAYLEGKFNSKQNKYTKQNCTLTASEWSNNTQTVAVNGVTVDNDVDIFSDPSNLEVYGECGVKCSAQANGSLTFTCIDTPASNLAVIVRIWN